MINKISFCLAMALFGVFMFSAFADAAMIRNKTSQRLLVPLSGNRTLNLVPGGTATISDTDLSSPNIQTLIQNGRIQVVPASTKNKPAKAAPSSRGNRY